jgi:glycosyltransferase involved in cell wall biosynthesis
MRVSFVIPTRNQARFLPRCIDSCLAQRLADREVIVVDGGSTDGTKSLLAAYGDRISWTSELDGGQGDAVNRGVARAKGELVAWINSDDYYADAGAVPAVVAVMELDSAVEVVYGDAVVVDVDGRRLRDYRQRRFGSARDLLVASAGPSQPATFFRRELFLAVGGLRTHLHYALDYELWLRLFPAARAVRRIDRVLACMTAHVEAKSSVGMLPQIRELAAIKLAHARAARLGHLDRARLALGISANLAYWIAVRSGLRRAF